MRRFQHLAGVALLLSLAGFPVTAQEIVLHDNGPLVNGVGTGVGGADESILQSVSLSMETFAFGHQVDADIRVADDFTIADPTGWAISSITFFAYQTGSPTSPSPFTAVNFRILDGPPPGANVIFGDTSTPCTLQSTTWADIYRVSEDTGSNTDRPIFANVCELDPPLVLAAGTYWLDWQTDGNLASGPWAPPITIDGETTTGDALQSPDDGFTYGPVNDGGTNTRQGFPFLIEGVPGLLVTDVQTADICVTDPSNENGIVEPGEVITVNVEVSAFNGSFTGISGTLTSPTPGVTVINGSSTYPDLMDGESSLGDTPFAVRLDEGIACLSQVDLDVTIASNEESPVDTTIFQAVGTPFAPDDVPVAFPDNDPAGAESDLVVGDDVVLGDVDVRVEIDHTWVGDLIISLRSPADTEVVLLDRPGVPESTLGCRDDNMDVTFDDDSSFDPEDHCSDTGTDPWLVGDASPVGSLADFAGESSAGTWTLVVSDNDTGATGTIVDWELITDPAVHDVCNVCTGGTIEIVAGDVSQLEGDAGSTAFGFPVSVSSTAFQVSVTAQTADGSATAGDDYTAVAPTVLTFPQGGPLTQTVTVQVAGDTDPEPDETFSVELSSPSAGAVLVDGTGLGTIEDDDAFKADVVGTKEVTGGNLAHGGTVVYTVVLTNLGPGLQQDNPEHEFIDVLPAGLELLSAAADSGTATAAPGTNTVTWNGEIPAGDSVTISIEAAIPEDTPLDTEIANQGTIQYDADGFTSNEATRPTDDPGTADPEDPTVLLVLPASVLEIPTLGQWALWLLALTLAGLGAVRLRG